MPWAQQMCKQHLGLKIIQPQKSIWTEETSNKCLLCACPSVTFRPCSAEDSQAPRKNIQWRPLVTSTFWGQHNSYTGKSMRPLHIMVTSALSNRLGEGCILMVLDQENLKTCAANLLFSSLLMFRGKASDWILCYRPGEHTMPAYRMKRKTSSMWPGI